MPVRRFKDYRVLPAIWIGLRAYGMPGVADFPAWRNWRGNIIDLFTEFLAIGSAPTPRISRQEMSRRLGTAPFY